MGKTGVRGNQLETGYCNSPAKKKKLRLWNKQQQEKNRGEDGFKDIQDKVWQNLWKWNLKGSAVFFDQRFWNTGAKAICQGGGNNRDKFSF